jgi:hypothetical protein
MSYDTLDMTGMNFDAVKRRFAVLKANFGEGYQAGALVGSAAGTHSWTLSAGVLPDASSYGNLISGDPRFKYYWDFFADHVSNGNEPFIVEFRGKNYHAGFVDTEISMEVFTADLFGGGVEIEQRRIAGFTYDTDGSIPA